jgi:hypothetical protein
MEHAEVKMETPALLGEPPVPAPPWEFGNTPLPQTLALAPILRRLTDTALTLETDERSMAQLIEDLSAAELSLARCRPVDLTPRIGPEARPDQRVYLDHGRSIGAFNPCFPEYEILVDGQRSSGTVLFPLAFEGPPGLVHGGFLALFFDCVIQHHNCEYGVAGKTIALDVEYRRPTPILEILHFEIERSSDAQRITSSARIEFNGKVLCRASMEAVAGDRSRLPDVSPRNT